MTNLKVTTLKRKNLVLGLALALAGFGAVALRAGEKIQITDGNPAEFPSKNYGKDALSEPFNPLKRGEGGKGSLMPIMPSPTDQSTSRRNSKDDKKKSWTNPGEFDFNTALKEIFQIRDYSPESLQRQQKSDMERLWDDNKEKKDSKSDTSRSRKSGPQNKNEREEDSDQDQSSSPGLNPNGLLLPNQSSSSALNGLPTAPNLFNPSGSGKTGSVFDRIGSSQTKRMAEQNTRSQDFDKLLGSQKFLVDQIGDPINLHPDNTRQQINPVVGNRVPSLDVSGSAINGPFSRPGLGAAESRRGLLDFDTRVLGASSLAPAVMAPMPSQPILQPKPPVLDIPRRKF